VGAANHYIEVFSKRPGGDREESRVTTVTYYNEAGPREAGMVLTVDFLLEGQRFTAINGGPEFTFTEAVSLLVNCGSQDEVDYFSGAFISAGRQEGPVRLAQGPLRPVLADRPGWDGGDAGKPGPRGRYEGDAGHAPHEEDRPGRAAARLRRGLSTHPMGGSTRGPVRSERFLCTRSHAASCCPVQVSSHVRALWCCPVTPGDVLDVCKWFEQRRTEGG
jgi:hypothetical protein